MVPKPIGLPPDRGHHLGGKTIAVSGSAPLGAAMNPQHGFHTPILQNDRSSQSSAFHGKRKILTVDGGFQTRRSHLKLIALDIDL